MAVFPWLAFGTILALGVIYNIVTIPFPPYEIAVLAAGAGLDSLTIALFASIGATIGKIPLYTVGRLSRRLMSQATLENLNLARILLERYGSIAIVAIAATPIPDEPILIIAGITNYKLALYLSCVFLGKLLWLGTVAFVGRGIIQGVASIFGFATKPLGLAIFISCVLLATGASAYIATKINWTRILRFLHVLPEDNGEAG